MSGFLIGPSGVATAAVGGGPFTGPGDSATFLIWGSVARGYSAAYAAPGNNPAFTVTTLAGGASQIINVLSTGLTDTATLNSWIGTNGTAYVSQLYDQTGGGNHWTQATGSKKPTITVSGINSLPTMTFASASAQILATGSAVSSATPFVMQAVARRTANFTNAQLIMAVTTPSDTELGFANVADTVQAYHGSVLTGAALDSAAHAIQNEFPSAGNGTLYIDGATSTGAVGTTSTNGNISLGAYLSSVYMDGYISEAGMYSGNAVAGVQTNARTAYGL